MAHLGEAAKAVFKSPADISVDRYVHMVESQKAFISTMANDDIRLEDARLLLANMQQGLAAAELGQAIFAYSLEDEVT